MNELISQTELKNQIDDKTVYSVFKDTHTNQVFLDTGKNIKKYFRKNYGVNLKTWVDFLNSGRLPQGKYKMFEVKDGTEQATMVYEGYSNLLLLDAPVKRGASKNNLADQILPIANSINQKTDMRTLAESMSMHTAQTIQTLQDELRSKDDFVMGLQNQLSQTYDMNREREKEIQQKLEAMQQHINKIELEKIELQRKLEMEIWKNSLEKELFQQVKMKEKELDAKEKEMNSGNMLKDLLDTAKPLIQTVGMGLLTKNTMPMGIPATMGMANNMKMNGQQAKANFESEEIVYED